MMRKRGVVLQCLVNINFAERMPFYEAVGEAAVSQWRSVVNAAVATTFGPAIGTVLAMFLPRVLYAVYYRVAANQEYTLL